MLLAIDTSTSQLGLALYNGTSVPGEMTWTDGGYHTRQLAPAVAALLSNCSLSMKDIQVLGVALGPGSFTALRVGLAFAKGLAVARALPIIGIPTLDILAATIRPADKNLGAVLQAGRGRLALVWYLPMGDGWKAQGAPTVTTASELAAKIRKPVIICGELTEEDRQHLGRRYKNVILPTPAQCMRRPAILAEIAWQRWQSGQVDSPVALAPIYLHTAGDVPA